MQNQSAAVFGLSAQQKQIWSGQANAFPWNAVALVQIEGVLHPDRLHQALCEVISRHEILRTVFRLHPSTHEPSQAVLDECAPAWEVIDVSNLDLSTWEPAGQEAKLEEHFRRGRGRRFDLAHGPVVSGTLLRRSDRQAALILTLPALLGDSQSLTPLLHELGSIYADLRQSLPAEPLRYVQFAQFQTELLESMDDNARRGKAFWARLREAGSEPVTLPEESAYPAAFQPQSLSFTLPNVVGADESVLLAAWQSLIWRLTGQSNFHTAVFIGGRLFEELEQAPGVIGKYVPAPAKFEGEIRFRDVAQRTKVALDQALEWQEYFNPSDGSAPVAFEYTQLGGEQVYGDLRFKPLQQSACCERFVLNLSAQRRDDSLTLTFHFDAARLKPETIQRWIGHFQVLLAAALDKPEVAVSRLPLLTEEERHRLLVEWNQTAVEFPRDRCIHHLFESQAALTPDRIAVRFREDTLTYRELHEQANQLAHHLRRIGVGPGSLVGLCVSRGLGMIVGLAAVLKAGGAYVPLEADNPKQRLLQQLTGAVALVTETGLLPAMPEFAGPCVYLDRRQWSEEPRSNPESGTTPEHLAYVIFTSGSTGVPKGVAVRHRNLVNYTNFIRRRLALSHHQEGWHFATVSTLSADLGNTAIFPALAYGGCVHVIAEEVYMDSSRMAQYCAQYPIDVLKIVPSHLEALLATAEGAGVLPRNYLILGGEALTRRLVQRIRDLGGVCEIGNHYGPTETTVESVVLRMSDYPASDGREQTVPIGRPVDNTQIYILDAFRQPVPIGVTGELYVAGEGVAAGYLNQPELTAERFLENPCLPASTMYRTGDLCRYFADGTVDFLGRADDQVKIRGYRVELGEVEGALTSHPGVRQAVVIAKTDSRGDKRLIAYVIGQASSEDLRGYLAGRLPDYMTPFAIVNLPTLPLNANGKIDRKKLPEPEEAPVIKQVVPGTATEEALATIWSEVLGRDRIGIRDNFFDLGGHSLLAIQISARVRDRLGVALDIQVVFDSPTIQGMAEAIDKMQANDLRSAEPPIIPVSREAYRVKK